MLSTKMLPAVGVLYPIYADLRAFSWAFWTHRVALVVILMLINLPIIVWMLYTYFKRNSG